MIAVVLVGAGCGSSHRLVVSPSNSVRGSIEEPDEDAGASDALTAMSFPTPLVGYMMTGARRLLATRDAGRHWRDVGPAPLTAVLDFVSPRLGFALTTDGRMMRTTNAGRAWRLVRRFGVASQGPFGGAVDFIDAEHGWVVPLDGRVYRTVDGGRTWERLPFRCDFAFGGLSFVDTSTGFAACGGQPATIMQGKDLYETHDGGSSWRLIGRSHLLGRGRGLPDVPLTGHVAELRFRTPASGFLVADRAGIYVTRNGGRTWRTALFTDDGWPMRVTAWPGARMAYALLGPYSDLLRSVDGGRHWRLVYPRRPGPPANAISFTSAMRGMGAGTIRYDGTPGTIVATRDGGRTWTQRGHIDGSVTQLLRPFPHVVWAVAHPPLASLGDHDALYESRDEGKTWRKLPVPRQLGFAAADVAPDGTSFLADNHGALYRSNDRGRSWDTVRRRGRNLGGAQFTSARDGLLATQRALLRTTDGGRTWHPVQVKARLEGVVLDVLDGKHWWLSAAANCHGIGPKFVGVPTKRSCDRLVLLRTGDAGRHWEEIRLPRLPGDFRFVTPRLGYSLAVGEGIFRTTDGGRTWNWIRAR